MHSRQTHKKHTNQPRINPHPKMGPRTGRSHANRPIARITAKWGLRNYHCSDSCIFKICICLHSLQPHGSKHSKSKIEHFDKRRLLNHSHYNRQWSVFVSEIIHEEAEILSIKLKHAATNMHKPSLSWNGPTPQSSLLENGIWRIQETMAQIFTNCNPELQHDIPFQHRL